jgi:hypothetical protein
MGRAELILFLGDHGSVMDLNGEYLGRQGPRKPRLVGGVEGHNEK